MKYDLKDKRQLDEALKLLHIYAEQGKSIELKAVRQKRSLDQNAYFHVCIGIFAVEQGYTIKEMKQIIYSELDFMNHVKPDLNGEMQVFTDSSTNLDTVEMTMLIDYVRNRANEMGCYIPTPEEYLQNQFEIDNYLKYTI